MKEKTTLKPKPSAALTRGKPSPNLKALIYHDIKILPHIPNLIQRAPKRESLKGESLKGETPKGESLKVEPLKGEPQKGEPLKGEPLKGEPL